MSNFFGEIRIEKFIISTMSFNHERVCGPVECSSIVPIQQPNSESYSVNEGSTSVKYESQFDDLDSDILSLDDDSESFYLDDREIVTSELPTERITSTSPIIQFPDSDTEDNIKENEYTYTINFEDSTSPIEKATDTSEETIGVMEISNKIPSQRKRRIGRQENGNISLFSGQVVSLGDGVNEVGVKRPLSPTASNTSVIPDETESTASSIEIIQNEYTPGKVLVNIRNLDVSTGVDVHGFGRKRFASNNRKASLRFHGNDSRSVNYADFEISSESESSDSELIYEAELEIKRLLCEGMGWDVKDEGLCRHRKCNKPLITKREIADRQMFNEISYFDVCDSDAENSNIKSDSFLPTSPLTSEDFTHPLTVASIMLVTCPVCIKKYAGSKILYLSPCQHFICRTCFLTLRNYQVDNDVRCPLCKTVASETFMFYRSNNSIGRMAHFSALPRKEN